MDIIRSKKKKPNPSFREISALSGNSVYKNKTVYKAKQFKPWSIAGIWTVI